MCICACMCARMCACMWCVCVSICVCAYRTKELSKLKGRKYLDALCVYFWATTPVLISILTFTTYVALGNKLTAAKVCKYSSVCMYVYVHVHDLPIPSLGVHKHCPVQCTDWSPQRLPLGDQWTNGGTRVTEEDPILHVNGDTEFTALLFHY